MADITFKGNPIKTSGSLPEVGSTAKDFKLTGTDLADVTLKEFTGKKVLLNIFPSLDTAVCAASVRRFNQEAGQIPNTVVLCASRDLPFAHKRFCTSEGIENVVNVSEMRDMEFGKDYGLRIEEGGLAGLFSRAVVVIDENGKVIYTEQVPEIGQEPDYEAAIKSLS